MEWHSIQILRSLHQIGDCWREKRRRMFQLNTWKTIITCRHDLRFFILQCALEYSNPPQSTAGHFARNESILAAKWTTRAAQQHTAGMCREVLQRHPKAFRLELDIIRMKTIQLYSHIAPFESERISFFNRN